MSNTDIWGKYKKISEIGYGSNGNVYKIKDKKTGDYYAIKEIKKEKCEILENILLEEINKNKTENKI